MKIQVLIKSVYGVDKIYPQCEKARLFAELTRKVNLDERDLSIVKALGYDVEELTPKKLELNK